MEFNEPLIVNDNQKQKTGIEYDLSCMHDDGSVELINFLSSTKELVENEALKGISVSVSDEEKFGEMMIESVKESRTLIESGARYRNLKSILSNLEKRIANPRGFNYEIFLVEDTMVNAFTAGGKILFLKGCMICVKIILR